MVRQRRKVTLVLVCFCRGRFLSAEGAKGMSYMQFERLRRGVCVRSDSLEAWRSARGMTTRRAMEILP